MNKYFVITIATAGAVFVAGSAMAQATAPTPTGSLRVSPGQRAAALGKNVSNGGITLTALQERADKEIDNRIQALNGQLKRIGEMVRLTDDQKKSLQTSEQGIITSLTDLKTKIAADTDMTILRQDVQSITKSERVYMLVIPQTAILSAAERINTVAIMLSGIQAKLVSRLSDLTGEAATTVNSEISDMKTKISNAQTAAQNATTAVVGLQPDNGVQATLTANNTALKNARAQIVAAQKDLQAAQKDAKAVLQSLKSLPRSLQPATNSSTSTPAVNQ